jgi:group I intron endonuclease
MGYIYLITNKINGKQYIGQSCCEDINSRWNDHKRCKKTSLGTYLYNAYKKHGIENFKYQLICICFDEDCDTYEKEYIKKYNTLLPNGYNMLEGGKSVRHSKETRELIKQNVQKSIAVRAEKVREYYKTHDHPNKGKHLTEEHKKKVGQKTKENWANMTDEQREKISQERKSRKYKQNTRKQFDNKTRNEKKQKLSIILGKKVGKYTMKDEFIEIYNSISEAAEKNNISRCSIGKTCSGKGYKSAGGFKWKFIV